MFESSDLLKPVFKQTVAKFTVAYLSYLDENGHFLDEIPAVFSREMLCDLYKKMSLLRAFDTKAVNLQRTGQLGTYPSSLGQEAVGVGIGAAMHADDVLVPYYRDAGAQFQRACDLEDILRYWGGSEQGSAFAPSEDFPICVPIATQLLHAAGVARAIQYKKESRAVVTTCGEGGTSKGDFYEALNVAGSWQLPFVCVVNNNQWAISVPRSAQTQTQTIAQKAIAAGIEGLQVDGNDILAVYTAVAYAIKKARLGQGPTLIEAVTYRLCDHTTADDAKRYRDDAELTTAWQKEPILRLKKCLMQHYAWTTGDEQALEKEIQTRLARSVENYLATASESSDAMFDTMYADLPMHLQLQKAEAKKYS